MVQRKMTRGLVAAFVAVLFVLVGGSAAQAQYGGGGNTDPITFTIDDSTVVAGQSVGVSGTGCAANEDVTFTIGETTVGTTTADAEGNYSGTITIPSLSPGTYTLNASCGSDVLGLDITVTETGGGTTTTTTDTGALARTGSNLAPLAGIGAAAIVLGAAAVYGTRRKREA